MLYFAKILAIWTKHSALDFGIYCISEQALASQPICTDSPESSLLHTGSIDIDDGSSNLRSTGLKLRMRNRFFFLRFLNQNIGCGYSKEQSQ